MQRFFEENRMIRLNPVRKQQRSVSNLITEFISVSENLADVPEGFPGQLLEPLYLVLKNIFSFLPARDLGSAACVCQTWNKVAKKMLKKRNKMSWVVVPLVLPANVPAYEFHSSNFKWDLVSLPIIFISQPGKFRLPDRLQVTNKAGLTKTWRVKDWLKDCLIQSTKYPYPYIAFPCAFFSGVIGLGNGASGPNLYTCCLPKIANVEINMYTVGNFDESDLAVANALLVFLEHEDHDVERTIKQFAPKDTPEKMALCGGYTSQNKIVDKEKFRNRSASIYISFVASSDSLFTAYSLVLSSDSEYCTSLKKQKELMQLRENTLVIKVVCTGVRDKAKEYQAFLSVFPDVPYFELYTEVGEIGWNSKVRDSEQPESKKRKTGLPKFDRQYTCCYMFLTWDN